MLSPVHSVPASAASAGMRGDECLFSSRHLKVMGLKYQKSNPQLCQDSKNSQPRWKEIFLDG